MQVDLLNSSGRAAGFSVTVIPFVPAREAPDNRALLAQADHRIGNHLALLAGYVRLQAAHLADQREEPTRDSMKIVLAGVGAQIAAVARLHRALTSDEPWGSADLGEQLHQICAGFAASFTGGTEIIEEIRPGCTVRPDQVLPLSQILAEVITDALGRAQQGGACGKIVVGCGRDDLAGLVIEVSGDDPGPGATLEPETDGGLGHRLIIALSRQLGARIAFQSTGRGFHFRLTLPRSPA